MSLLACQPLYSVVTSKKGLILGGLSNLADNTPTGSILKLDFETETFVDTTRSLSTKKAFLASAGFAGSTVSAGGDLYGSPTSGIDRYDLTSDTSEVASKSLALARTYLAAASNLAVGVFSGGSFGKPYGLIEHYTSADGAIIPSNHLAKARVGHTSTANSYEALMVGYNDQVESYTFSTKSIYTKFASSLKLVGQSSSSTTDLGVFQGGQYDFPVAFQYKIRYADKVEVPVSNLSTARVGASSLSNTAISYTVGGSELNDIEKYNFFDNTTYVSFSLNVLRYFSGYASNCHGGTVQ